MISGERVYLAALDAERDVTPRYVDWLNDPDVYRFLSTKFPQTAESIRAYLRGIRHPNFIARIVLRDSDQHVGNIAMQSFDPVHRNMELGILIGEADARGKGYGREACALAIRHVFDHLGVQKVTAGTVAENAAMTRVFLSLGFTVEGELRRHYVLDGNRLDVLRFGLLPEEFRFSTGGS